MKIKIDRSSIRENPNAGSTVSYIQGKSDITFTFKGELPDCLNVNKNCVITYLQTVNNEKIYHGRLTSNDVIDKLRLKGALINISCANDRVYHDPIPKYSFEYENVEIICKYCHEKFMSDDLVDDFIDDGEYCYSTHNGCPKCNVCDCCDDITYEKIEEVSDIVY